VERGPGSGDALDSVLEEARSLGFLGPGEISRHVAHARGFADAVSEPPRRVLDLGSGGGIPGLVLASVWPDAAVVLSEASARRTSFLTDAVVRLGMGGRVTVVHDRAESLARDSSHRGAYDLVVARSFGAPAVTAECSAGFLCVGGFLVTSEPPEGRDADDRWPSGGLALLGMESEGGVSATFAYHVVRQVALADDRYPRRVGVPAKRPLF
jgi:16S rRNA (guanine527-N7)-methyltransferase